MKITFWWREIAGWVLVLLGLIAFYKSWQMLTPPRESFETVQTAENGPQQMWVRNYPQIFEAPPVAFMGFIIFRGGIHLLKVAVAARVAVHAGRQLEEANRRPKLPLPRPAAVRR
ncbi:MAG TPA: hypothetical protein VKS79_26875 [Gemmataceae bacterium]|nr:hypothetical protein [Gemmataceae bacterium]